MYTIQSTLYIIPWSCITNTTHYDVIEYVNYTVCNVFSKYSTVFSICVRACVYVCMYMYVCACIYVCVYVCGYMCVCGYMAE